VLFACYLASILALLKVAWLHKKQVVLFESVGVMNRSLSCCCGDVRIDYGVSTTATNLGSAEALQSSLIVSSFDSRIFGHCYHVVELYSEKKIVVLLCYATLCYAASLAPR